MQFSSKIGAEIIIVEPTTMFRGEGTLYGAITGTVFTHDCRKTNLYLTSVFVLIEGL